MSVAAVVIGRNEGERLRRCLEALSGIVSSVIYVDSGSTDGSVALAKANLVEVVELDMSTPFSAARARNAGFAILQSLSAEVDYVQFVDGDCEIKPTWPECALAYLAGHSDVAMVAGRLKERFPEESVYNRLGDLEWNFAGPGQVDAVGGIFMIRKAAFEAVGGFDETVMAGEEPELCQRLIRQSWKLVRLDCDMAWHDLSMTSFGQWWRRQVRNGYGGLDVARRFGLAPFRRNNLRAQFWSVWPAFIGLAAGLAGALSNYSNALLAALVVTSLWPAQAARIALRTWRGGQTVSLALAYGFFTMLSFWPQMIGQLRYLFDQVMGRVPIMIEYKNATTRKPQNGGVWNRQGTRNEP